MLQFAILQREYNDIVMRKRGAHSSRMNSRVRVDSICSMLTDFMLIPVHCSQNQFDGTLLRDLYLRLCNACHVAKGHESLFCTSKWLRKSCFLGGARGIEIDLLQRMCKGACSLRTLYSC